jgi:hypothetical protein
MNSQGQIANRLAEFHCHGIARSTLDIGGIQNRRALAVAGIIGHNRLEIGISLAIGCRDRGAKVAEGDSKYDCIT